jgi:hypothetical protein
MSQIDHVDRALASAYLEILKTGSEGKRTGSEAETLRPRVTAVVDGDDEKAVNPANTSRLSQPNRDPTGP